MDSRAITAQALVDALRKRTILTIDDLSEIAQRTPATVWRILKPIGYYTSFNFNAKFYTLAETPRFDANHLWFFRDVGFSSYGSLNRTLVGLVETSEMGLTQSELSALLHVNVQNQLFHLFAQRKLARTNWGRMHVYLAFDEETQEQQLRRQRATREGAPVRRKAGLPSDREIIAIMAELATQLLGRMTPWYPSLYLKRITFLPLEGGGVSLIGSIMNPSVSASTLIRKISSHTTPPSRSRRFAPRTGSNRTRTMRRPAVNRQMPLSCPCFPPPTSQVRPFALHPSPPIWPCEKAAP